MPAPSETLLAYVGEGAEKGRTVADIRKRFGVKATEASAARAAELDVALRALADRGAIRGPFQKTKTQVFYFAAGFGPSLERASAAISALARASGVRLISHKQLEAKLTGLDKPYFADGLADACAKANIMELKSGVSRLYLHRETAAERFAFEAAPPAPEGQPAFEFEDFVPLYHRLKKQQGGFSAVKIFDVARSTEAPRSAVHRTLIEAARAGRVTLHPSNSVELPAEVVEAGVRMEGFSEPFITVVLKEAP